MNGAPREIPESTQCIREYFEDPSGVLKTNPRGHKLRGFLAKGLAEDVAEGFVVNIPGMSPTHW